MNTNDYGVLLRNYGKEQTEGRLMLYRDGEMVFTCVTLELPNLDNQKNVSCVLEGSFKVVREYSPKFKKMLFELKDVPNRSEIKIHRANYVRQLQGCIAPGLIYMDIDKDGLKDVSYSSICEDVIGQIMPDEWMLHISEH